MGENIPNLPSHQNKPWISESILALIDQRVAARARNDYEEEKRLHKEVRKKAKKIVAPPKVVTAPAGGFGFDNDDYGFDDFDDLDAEDLGASQQMEVH